MIFNNSLTRCFRLNHTLTQYLIILGSLIFFYFLYSGGYHRLLAAVVVNSSSLCSSVADNRATISVNHQQAATSLHNPTDAVEQPSVIDSRRTTIIFQRLIDISTTTTTNRVATTTNHRLVSSATIKRPFNSTCSLAADGRGPHQNVISYSIYGKNFSDPSFFDLYLKSFTEILASIPTRYPGWVVRIYHELKSDDVSSWKVFNKVLDLNVNSDFIDLCNATQIIKERQLGDLFEMTWRWLPLLDEMVDTFMSRDSDSLIIAREQAAVAQWLASNKTFHVMRDHPLHCLFFLGGGWGVKISQRRHDIITTAEKMFQENHVHSKGYDQTLLIRHFQSMASQSLMAHDSYCCGNFQSYPFPTPRENGTFFGWQTNISTALTQPCPKNCRPHNLTGALALANWTMC